LAENTKSKAILEARNKTKEYEKKKNKTVGEMIKNAAVILSVSAVILLFILYAYCRGYYGVFNIPENYFNLDLQNYLPVVFQMCGVFMYFSYYFSSIKKDKILKKRRINFLRVFWGVMIVLCILNANNVKGIILYILFCILSCIIFMCIELFFYLGGETRSDKEISNIEYQFILENYIEDFVMLSLYKIFGITIVVVLLAPYWGKFQAHLKNNYEVLTIDNQQYSIIVNHLDKAVVQKVSINGNELVVHTDSYMLVSKENIVIQNKRYDIVIIEQ